MLSAKITFDRLKTLQGQWSGINEDGNLVSMRYYLTANDTALVEDWTFHNGMTALTVFHLDGEDLMAAHYCPLGNQPRLLLDRRAPDAVLTFTFIDITHLTHPDNEHCCAFDMTLNADGTLMRNETYTAAGHPEINGTLFRRMM